MGAQLCCEFDAAADFVQEGCTPIRIRIEKAFAVADAELHQVNPCGGEDPPGIAALRGANLGEEVPRDSAAGPCESEGADGLEILEGDGAEVRRQHAYDAEAHDYPFKLEESKNKAICREGNINHSCPGKD